MKENMHLEIDIKEFLDDLTIESGRRIVAKGQDVDTRSLAQRRKEASESQNEAKGQNARSHVMLD